MNIVVIRQGLARADEVVLQTYRIVYSMGLASATQQSSFSGTAGLMDYKLLENCRSWSSETKVYLKISYLGEREVISDWSSVSLEAKDGKA